MSVHHAAVFCDTCMYLYKLWWHAVNSTMYMYVSLFPCQATFPKAHGDLIFEILTKPNKHMKTPLHLAIENGNVG